MDVIVGRVYGQLTIIQQQPHGRGGLCTVRCACGQICKVRYSIISKGRAKSCGVDACRFSRSKPADSSSISYMSWSAMRARCQNVKHTKYGRYGGRGITVCDRWQVYRNFIEDLGERPSRAHTIDRINGEGNYEPGNVRWATKREQQGNLKNNVNLTHDGETHNIHEWARRCGISPTSMQRRHKAKLPPERLFSRGKLETVVIHKVGEATGSITEFARRYNVSPHYFYRRTYKGMSVTDIVMELMKLHGELHARRQ